MAITGRKNEQSLADYDDLDSEEHLHLGEILSGKKSSPKLTSKLFHLYYLLLYQVLSPITTHGISKL